MNYSLLKDVISLLEDFETANTNYSKDIKGFKLWVAQKEKSEIRYLDEPTWEGKDKGRSPESVINTLIVHMNRYAKTYSKSAIQDSNFSTQEDFIYLINLKAFGSMTKMDLIKKNIHDKPTGIQIINRLISQGWVGQQNSDIDKRSKVIKITNEGLKALENQMSKIRQATRIVTGDLNYNEKMELIRLLNKLEHFHNPIFSQNIESERLLDIVFQKYIPVNE